MTLLSACLSGAQVVVRLDPSGSGEGNAARVRAVAGAGQTVLIDAQEDCPWDTLSISKARGLTLKMAPGSVGRLVYKGAEGVAVRLVDSPDARVSLRIDGTEASTPPKFAFGTDALVSLLRCDRATVEDCQLVGAPLAAIAVRDSRDAKVLNNRARLLRKRGIIVRGGSGALVKGNSLIDGESAKDHLVDLHAHREGRVEDNSVSDVLGIAYQDTEGESNVWTGNRATDCAGGFFKSDGTQNPTFTDGIADNVGGCILELKGQSGQSSGRVEFSRNIVRGVSASLYGKGVVKQGERFRLVRTMGLAPGSTFVMKGNRFERITNQAWLLEGFDPSVTQEISGNEFGNARLIEPGRAMTLGAKR